MASAVFKDYAFLCHNSGRFDGILLLKAFMEKQIPCTPLFDGNSIFLLNLTQHRIRFIDSIRYVKLPLARFTKRFPRMRTAGQHLDAASEAEGEAEGKGAFPHFMNKPANYDYDGAFPGISGFFLDPETERAKTQYGVFEQSWREEGRSSWNFKEQLHLYMMQDVRVLRGGMLQLLLEFVDFQEELQRGADDKVYFHPYSSPFFTVSTFIHALWRAFAMEEGSIFLLSNQKGARKTSRCEIEYLSFLEHSGAYGDLVHAMNSPEGQKKIGRYWPDGFSAQSNTVVEVLGCGVHWHRGEEEDCPISKNFAPNDKNPFGAECHNVYAAWLRKKAYYERLGLVVKPVWECQANALKDSDPAFARFLKEVFYAEGRPLERLKLRQGLRGGRTEVFRMLYSETALPAERLVYIDVNSLYPHSSIVNEFPVGRGELLIGAGLSKLALTPEGLFHDGAKVVGLLQATVLPPGNLFLPVLPTKAGNKLVFGLCRVCMETRSKALCRHTSAQRAITDVWTSAELCFALECGYEVCRIWEAWIYRECKPLFREFYLMLARKKLEAEGFPPGANTPEERQRHVDNLNDLMPGLGLEASKVEKNPGAREFAKLLSNTGLGKFSQSDGRDEHRYVHSYGEFAQLVLRSPKSRVKGLTPLTEQIAEVSLEPKEEFLGAHRNTNAVIYSFVTAFARCQMARDMRFLMAQGAKLFYSEFVFSFS